MGLMKTLLHWVLDRAARWLVGHPVLMIAGVLAYVVMPLDVLPEALLGPIGYLEDIFVMLLPLILRSYVRKHPAVSPHPDAIETTAE